jgi:hypothetical protein
MCFLRHNKDTHTHIAEINKTSSYIYSKTYKVVPLPLPSRYRPVTVPLPSRYHPVNVFGPPLPTVTDRYRFSSNVTLPLPYRCLTVTHRYRYDRFFRKFHIFFTSLFFLFFLLQ